MSLQHDIWGLRSTSGYLRNHFSSYFPYSKCAQSVIENGMKSETKK
jgi:hypothetical protein